MLLHPIRRFQDKPIVPLDSAVLMRDIMLQ